MATSRVTRLAAIAAAAAFGMAPAVASASPLTHPAVAAPSVATAASSAHASTAKKVCRTIKAARPAPKSAKVHAAIRTPHAGRVSGRLSVTATAGARAGIAKVVLLAGGCQVATDSRAPFTLTWNTAGVTTKKVALQVVAIDRRGHQARSKVVRVTIASTAAPQAVRGTVRDNFGTLAAPVGGYFGSGSVWKTPVAHAGLSVNSASEVATLAGQVNEYYGGTAAFNVWQSNESMITAPAGTRTTRVIFDDCQDKGYTPSTLYGPGGIFLNVPIPANAVPASGTDAGMAIYSPSTDQLWSFWKAKHESNGWHACWGGRIDHVSTNPGYFLNGGGATATGLSSEGGAITIRDIESGSINHAMSLAIPDPATWTDFSWPAQRSDGSASSTSNVAEGTRFRLNPSINVNSLGLSPIAKMIAIAAQKYGFIVTDKAGAVSVVTESGNVIANARGTNPWGALLGSTPSYEVLKNFPWSKMQALPANWNEPRNPIGVRVAPKPTTPLATVTRVFPNSGPQSGGTRVTITGAHFTGVTGILVGVVPVRSFSCPTSTMCTLVTPPSADASWHSILVTTAAGTSSKVVSDEFTYVN